MVKVRKHKYYNILAKKSKFHNNKIEYLVVNVSFDPNIKKLILSVDEIDPDFNIVRNRYILCYEKDYEAVESCGYKYHTLTFEEVQTYHPFDQIKLLYDYGKEGNYMFKHMKDKCNLKHKFGCVYEKGRLVNKN